MNGLENEGTGAAPTATGPNGAKACGPASLHNPTDGITQNNLAICSKPSGAGINTDATMLVNSVTSFQGSGEERVSPGSGINALIEALNSGLMGLIRWDQFLMREVIIRNEATVPVDKAAITMLLADLERLGFKRVRRRDLEDAVHVVAKTNHFDSAQECLAQLPAWDGVKRIERFLPDYLGTRSGRYELAVSRYFLTAIIARILVPGCKADMVPVLIGPQGFLKSSVLVAIAPTPDHCGEACLTNHSTELVRKAVGKTLLVWEEMRGITGKADADEVKTFITIPYLEMRSSDHAGMDRHPRRFIIVGTSNQKDILRDVTGNRRYLPFEIPSKIALDKVIADRLQLLAEALHVVRDRIACGQSPVDFEEAERFAGDEHRGFVKEGRWVGCKQLRDWLDHADDGFSTEDALNAIGMSSAEITRREKLDMTATLEQLEYEKRRTRVSKTSNPVERWHKRKADAVT